MKINDWFTTLKIEPRTGWLVIIMVVVAIAAILFLSTCNKKPVATQAVAIIDNTQKQLEKGYQDQLKAKETENKDLKSRLVVSEGKYKVLVKKYSDLQKVKEDVQIPKTDAEMRDRFIAAGFPPLPAK